MLRGYRPKLKFQVVMEVISEGKNTSQVARTYEAHPNTVRKWIKKFRENKRKSFNGYVKCTNLSLFLEARDLE